ncbi:hypothetical protein AMTRI_Chr12g268860 [Amborella trichopoda]
MFLKRVCCFYQDHKLVIKDKYSHEYFFFHEAVSLDIFSSPIGVKNFSSHKNIHVFKGISNNGHIIKYEKNNCCTLPLTTSEFRKSHTLLREHIKKKEKS